MLVLGPARGGNAAGELYRIDLTGRLPVHVAGGSATRIPFVDRRLAALGSLAIDPATHVVFLGEENGTRVYRLASDGRAEPYAGGLQHLAGGSTIAIDGRGRLLVLDFVQPGLGAPDEPVPPGLEEFRQEDYRGPLVFRLSVDVDVPLPRRLDRLAPFFPRAWGGRAGGARLPLIVAVAPVGDDAAMITSAGEVLRLTDEGRISRIAWLPRGQYLRIHMVSAPDGSLYVSGGFWMGTLFRVSPGGTVTTLATNLGDPQGVGLDASGRVYLVESSAHRIVRFSP
jgi:hypothetical protein